MLQSHIIEVDGVFVAAAVRQDVGYRLVAIDLRAEELDGSVWSTLEEARRLTGALVRTGRLPLKRPAAPPQDPPN
jgi:hypothetical protein